MRLRLMTAVVLAVAGIAAGCGGSGASSSSSSPASAQAVIRAGSAAIAKQTSVGFHATLDVTLHGNVQGAGTAGAMFQGPVSLALSGHAATGHGQTGKADIQFALNFSGGSVSGRLLTPDGKTGYLQLPSVMGPGWHSFPISSVSSSAAPSGSSAQARSILAGAQPRQWLTNLEVSSAGGATTVSAQLSVARMLATLAANRSGSPMTAAQRRQLARYAASIKTARGSISYGNDHLPTALHTELDVSVPAALTKSTDGIQGFDLKLSSTFDDWSKDFTVTRPATSTPLNTSSASMLAGA